MLRAIRDRVQMSAIHVIAGIIIGSLIIIGIAIKCTSGGGGATNAPVIASALITPARGVLIYANNPQVFAVTVTMSGAVSGDKAVSVRIEEIGSFDTELDNVSVTIKDGQTSGAAVFVLRCAITRPYTLVGAEGEEENESSFSIRPIADDGSFSGFEGEKVFINCIDGTHPGTSGSSMVTGDALLEVPGFGQLLEEYLVESSLNDGN